MHDLAVTLQGLHKPHHLMEHFHHINAARHHLLLIMGPVLTRQLSWYCWHHVDHHGVY